MIPKFRVWHKDGKVMLSNYLGFTITDAGQLLIESMLGDEATMEKVELDNYIVMQYTGLKDKNGVEIYEGDILKTFSNINKYTDSFAEDIEPKFEYTTVVRDGACFKTTYKKRPSYVLNENSGSMVEHMEVIGNIYENPELLKEQNK